MKRKDVTDAYYYNTTAVSTIVRGLSLSGVALVWLFRITDAKGSHLPGSMWPALWLFLITLFLDLVQYVVASAVWGHFDAKLHSDGKTEDSGVAVPKWARIPQSVCYWGKLATITIGYVCFLVAAYGPLAAGATA